MCCSGRQSRAGVVARAISCLHHWVEQILLTSIWLSELTRIVRRWVVNVRTSRFHRIYKSVVRNACPLDAFTPRAPSPQQPDTSAEARLHFTSHVAIIIFRVIVYVNIRTDYELNIVVVVDWKTDARGIEGALRHTTLEGLGLGLPLHSSVLDIIQETSFIRLIRRLRV
jgi:hypothetical protein